MQEREAGSVQVLGQAVGIPGGESAPSLPCLLCGFLETPELISVFPRESGWREGWVCAASGHLCSVPLTAGLELRQADPAGSGGRRGGGDSPCGPASSDLVTGLWPEAGRPAERGYCVPHCLPTKDPETQAWMVKEGWEWVLSSREPPGLPEWT